MRGMAETILITGGAGTLGRATTEVLLARGDRVRILDLVAGEPRDGVEWLIGDLRRPEDVARAVEATDAIVHAA
ncbi:MAG: hypothetical protein QOG62_1903, partial [Thermoleophilaceae bacterium]|nr:hypothetical protein [Thermoleophilaceae bacterium]